MHFIGLCLRNLVSRATRSGLTALGVGVAVASFISLVGASRGLEGNWVRSLLERGIHMIAVRKGAVEILSASIDQSVGDELCRVEGVEAAAGELISLVGIGLDHNVLATGWDRTGFLWKTPSFSAGGMPREDQPRGIVLGEIMAEELEKKVGDSVLLADGSESLVTGISRHSGSMNQVVLVMALPAMQELMEKPGKVTLFNLRLRHPEDSVRVAQVKAALSRRFPSLRFSETRQVAEDDRILRLLRAMAWSVSLIALVMGALVTLNTLLMSVTERTYDIGVLTAIGWHEGRILSMILLEGLLLSLAGGALGCLLGVGALTFLTRLPALRGFLEPEVTPRLVLEVLAAALAMGVAGSLYPAWRALRLNPVDALRHE